MAAEITFYTAPPLINGTNPGALPAYDLDTVVVPIAAGPSAGAQVPDGARYAIVITAAGEPCRVKFGPAVDVQADNAEPGISRLLKADAEYGFVLDGRPFYSLIAAA